MPPSLATAPYATPAPNLSALAPHQAGWLLPAGLLLVLLALGRWAQAPASPPPTLASRPPAPHVTLSSLPRLPSTPAAAL